MEQRIGWDIALASLCLAFALSMAIAWTYSITHAGLSYMRGFTQSVAVGGVISALVMLAIGDDVARGLGVVGALTIVRFRTTLKDTRDLLFIFASLACGMAAGVRAWGIAVVGAGVFIGAAFLLSFTEFGSHRQYDAVLRLRMPADAPPQRAFLKVLETHCRKSVLVNLRQAGGNLQEYSYQVELASESAGTALLGSLAEIQGLTGVTLLMQDSSVEP